MDIFDSTKLPDDMVKKIRKFINWKQAEISDVCVNEIIRDDIFSLLDKYCTVIYYPINDKKNNGFHVTYNFNDDEIHFVYINTQQHKEKQIFTAAHELGHIWGVCNEFNVNNTELEERIVNRFASELLMPKEYFLNFIAKELLPFKGNLISVVDIIKVITATMNHFFTSYKSVIYRFYEIGILNENSCRLLWGDNEKYSNTMLIDLSEKIAKENGYSRLYQIDERKWINGLKELLDIASKTDDFSLDWLRSFYNKFDLDEKGDEEKFKKTLSIEQIEDGAEDDK